MQTSNPQSTANLKICRGFSLVELVVALLILAVGLLGLASLKAMALRQNQQLSLQARDAGHARNIMERMKALPHWRPDPKKAEIRQSNSGQIEIHLPEKTPSSPDSAGYRLRGHL